MMRNFDIYEAFGASDEQVWRNRNLNEPYDGSGSPAVSKFDESNSAENNSSSSAVTDNALWIPDE